MINDIDHIDCENVPYEDFGLELIDVQILHMIKLVTMMSTLI